MKTLEDLLAKARAGGLLHRIGASFLISLEQPRHLKVPLVLFPDNSGHGMEFAMAPLDGAAESATALQDGLLSSERDSEAPAEDRGLIAGLRDDGNGLAAARGLMIGTVLGVIVWAVILWGLL